jgi:glutamate synthase (NADPH/NADH) large chain
VIEGEGFKLNNCDKTVGGQVAIDIERFLGYELTDQQIADSQIIYTNQHKRHYLAPDSVTIRTTGSAGQSFAAFNNDGMRMEHYGTCNDGVGKTACGGTIVVISPGGGSKLPGENVIIGNFALFGATGGKAFINGEAGDRFGVRNSGAMAVVEGVGDFACEYMINGAVLNLGVFGKGFCTGMSGGNAYQYDPENRLESLHDASSIELRCLTEETDVSRAHEQIILHMLEQHNEAADSIIGKKIYDNWETERKHFKFAIPLWLYKTQTAQYLSQSMNSKVMVEELSVAYAQEQIKQIKQGYQCNEPLFNGEVPEFGDTDSALSFKLINSFLAIQKNRSCARDNLKRSGQTEITEEQITEQAEKIIFQRPRVLQDALVSVIREAYSRYTDEQLADLLANKRLTDYKTALSARDVQSIYSIGSTTWIIEQDQVNKIALANIIDIEETMAELAGLDIAHMILDES